MGPVLASRRSRFVPRAARVAALLLVVAGVGLGAAPVAPPAPVETLEDVMQDLKFGLKQLTTALEARKAPDALNAVGDMQRLVVAAKTHEPSNLPKSASKEEKAAQALAFRRDLIGVLRELADIEVDVLDAHLDQALEKVNGPLIQMRDAGHKKYKDKGGR
ncbi:MAG TPA: hypothetical protein VFY71_13090 [Planctomycetota bacterium]|nr:hypothetical protein [Planctomycetota bacterium]